MNCGSDALKEYVSSGGVLVADGRVVWTNEKGWLIDGEESHGCFYLRK